MDVCWGLGRVFHPDIEVFQPGREVGQKLRCTSEVDSQASDVSGLRCPADLLVVFGATGTRVNIDRSAKIGSDVVDGVQQDGEDLGTAAAAAGSF